MSREEFLKNKPLRLKELNEAEAELRKQLGGIMRQKVELEDNLFNFYYDDLKEAERAVEDLLYEEAAESCGDGYCGSDTIDRDYVVNGVRYICTGHFEYNRHDKRFYYLDYSKFSHKEVGPVDA